MSRPRWPVGMVLSVGAIHRIQEDMAEYDRDPEAYERREREARERQEEEEQRERDLYEQQFRQQKRR